MSKYYYYKKYLGKTGRQIFGKNMDGRQKNLVDGRPKISSVLLYVYVGKNRVKLLRPVFEILGRKISHAI